MLPEDEPKPPVDLGRARRVRGRGFHVRLPLAERLRAARRIPQAVVKITSYAGGKAHVINHLRYISRNGALALETDARQKLETVEEQRTMVEDWSTDFDERPRSRDAVAIVFSMPPGSPPEALRATARNTLARFFPEQEWVFGVHEDRDHPHAHALVKMRGREVRKKLRLNKPELYRLRETFATAAREQGVLLAASPRAARGVGAKGLKRAVYHLRKKGTKPETDRRAYQEAKQDLAAGKGDLKPWERAMKKRHQLEKEAYQKEARALRQAAAARSGQEREKLLRAVKDLERFAQQMPVPKTRREALLEQEGSKSIARPTGQDRKAPSELER